MWTPKRHFLTSQRVFAPSCVKYHVRVTSVGESGGKIKIRVKKRGLTLQVFRQALPYGRLAQILACVFDSSTQSIVQSFIIIGWGVYMLWEDNFEHSHLIATSPLTLRGTNVPAVITSSLLIPQWVLPNRMVHSVGEMPSLLTGYRLVTCVLHLHIFLVMTTKHSVRPVILL